MILSVSGKISSGKDTVGKIIQYLIQKRKDDFIRNQMSFDEFNEKYELLYSKYISENWQIKKFAGKLKQIVSILTGIPVEDLEKQEVKDRVLGEEWWYYLIETTTLNHVTKYKRYPYLENKHSYSEQSLIKPTIRQFLQELGTEAMRDVIHPNIWVNALFSDYIPREGDKKGSLFYPNWIITDMRFPNELQAIKDRGGITIRVNRSNMFDAAIKSLKIEHQSETALDNAEFDEVIENNGSIDDLVEKVKLILIKHKIL